MSSPDEVRALWIPASDQFEKFFMNHILKATGFYLPKDELYQAYCNECMKCSEKPEEKRTITAILERKGIIQSQRRSAGNKRTYEGIRWKDDSPYCNSFETFQKPLVPATDATGI